MKPWIQKCIETKKNKDVPHFKDQSSTGMEGKVELTENVCDDNHPYCDPFAGVEFHLKQPYLVFRNKILTGVVKVLWNMFFLSMNVVHLQLKYISLNIFKIWIHLLNRRWLSMWIKTQHKRNNANNKSKVKLQPCPSLISDHDYQPHLWVCSGA